MCFFVVSNGATVQRDMQKCYVIMKLPILTFEKIRYLIILGPHTKIQGSIQLQTTLENHSHSFRVSV
ncbi:hypothetical protein RJT34_25725 [Clitoria ternatea]|uniref:Uncharacterized protein n=1 Tax=Clitoria ternatea TaxID=43366 RepID=A0AAN9IJ22_CLITE